MKKPLVSVVVPIYNCEKYIDRCLESIVSQSFGDIEIVLIDDGSTDGSLARCKGYAEKDDRIIIYHQKNQGVSRARNKGMALASSRYITFVDGDDSISREYIEELVFRQRKYPNRIIRQGYREVAGSKTFYKSEPLRIRIDDFVRAVADGVINGSACGYLFDAELIKKNGIRFNASLEFLEDEAFVVEYLLKKAHEVIDLIGRDGAYVYYKNSDSKTNSLDYARRIDGYLTSLEHIDAITDYKYAGVIEGQKEKLILENIIGVKKTAQLKKIKKVLKKHNISSKNTVLRDICEKKYRKVLFIMFGNRMILRAKKLIPVKKGTIVS